MKIGAAIRLLAEHRRARGDEEPHDDHEDYSEAHRGAVPGWVRRHSDERREDERTWRRSND